MGYKIISKEIKQGKSLTFGEIKNIYIEIQEETEEQIPIQHTKYTLHDSVFGLPSSEKPDIICFGNEEFELL